MSIEIEKTLEIEENKTDILQKDNKSLAEQNQDAAEKTNNEPKEKKYTNRNYSFLNSKRRNLLDTVKDEDQEFTIPAQPGSCYWAILKVGYENHDQFISADDYITQVGALLEERNPEKWKTFKNKTTVKTMKNGEVVEKKARHWRYRIQQNIQTLMRTGGKNCYGRRLSEVGHSLKWETGHFGGIGAYILRTKKDESKM